MMRGPRDTVSRRMRAFQSPAFWRAVAAALYESADMVRAEAHRSITAGSVSGKKHKPSKPGDPPMNDSGVLARNIEVSQVAPTKARVTASAPYAPPLEFGTSTIAERPFMRPARDKVKPEAERILKARINAAQKQGGGNI